MAGEKQLNVSACHWLIAPYSFWVTKCKYYTFVKVIMSNVFEFVLNKKIIFRKVNLLILFIRRKALKSC